MQEDGNHGRQLSSQGAGRRGSLGTKHTGDMRDRILEAAARLVSSSGLQCSMATIAKEANVAVGSLYYYFDSKESLLAGLYTDVAQDIAEVVPVDYADDVGHEQRVRSYISNYLAFVLADPRRARLVDYLHDGFGGQVIGGEFHEIAIAKAIDVFADAQAAGVLRAGSPYMLSTFVRGVIRHVVRRMPLSDEVPVPELDVEALADMCWRAIAA